MVLTIIVCPKGTKPLIDKLFAQTKSYTKTKEIAKKQYNIDISLETKE